MAPRFRPAHLFRALRPNERQLAWDVFRNSLPPLEVIGVTDGLGDGNTIWTLDRAFHDFLQSPPPKSLDHLKYFLNFGDAVHWDLSEEKYLGTAVRAYAGNRARDVFVHEMVHVWQFHRGVPVKRQSIIARAIGGGYAFKRGKPWYTYNVEQQAEIIEAWNWERKDKSGTNDELFPYVHYIIRGENAWQLSKGEYNIKTLEELWHLLNLERTPVDDPIRIPTQVTVGDDYMVAVLSGDVLFDFDKAVVKPAADPVLHQAAATIRAKTTPRLRKILINGHADSIGGAGYNEKLSERRAEAVAQWFTSRNLLPAHLLMTQGFGEAQPRFPNTSRENMARNRRVEIIMVND